MNRTALVSSISAALLLASIDAALAQDADPATGDAQELDRIVVTGTRISNPNVVSPTPVSTLTAQDIEAVGAVNVGDIMTKMPQLATTFTMGNSTRFIGTAGVQTQDLRNLGTNRTLVLVNGRRFVGAAAGATDVDVNMIPAEWIERVEVITGGASAVYGADAVTGVVNFILKKDYEGAAVKAQFGTSEDGFDQKFLSASLGTSFADDRGNVAFSVEHSRQDAFMFRERFGNESYRALLTPGGDTDSVLLPDAGNYSITSGGTFFLGNDPRDLASRYVFDPDGSVRQQRFGGPTSANFTCQDCDRLDANAVQQLEPKFSRSTASGVASFDITPEHRLYWEGTFNHAHVKFSTQPAFGDYFIAPDNAYISPELAAIMQGEDLVLSRFDVDAGLRGEDTTRNTARMVFGANGLLTENWEYDAFVNYGVTREKRRNLNNRIVERFFASIDAVRDPASGEIVCRSTLDPAAIDPNLGAPISAFGREGCIPTSLFGDGAVSEAARAWFNTTTLTTSRITQYVAGGTLTNNNLFDVPGNAGAASLAAGVEYRRETSRQDNDPLDVSGQTFLNAIPSFSGEYDVKEGFVEFVLPVLADLPVFKNLNLDAAVRASEYSTIGSTEAWRWGLDWALDDNVRVRGTMSSAVRAPNIGELFAGQAQNFFAITDPCSASQIPNAPDPAVRASNCAALGIPADFIADDGATREGVSGSNPDLDPETGRTYTFGMVLTPAAIEGLSLNADYWNIELIDAVSAPTGQQTANRCVDTPSGIDNIYCGNVRRDPVSNDIVFVTSILQNISQLSTSGIDYNASYTHALGAGQMRWDVNATRVISFNQRPFQEDPEVQTESNETLGFPKWKATLRANYALGDWDFDWSMRYFSSMLRVTRESFQSNPTQTTPITAGSRTYSNLRVAYGPEMDGWQAYAGVNNVFDRDPPVNLFGTGFGSALYDVMGRSYYAGMQYRF